jgi:hypothetical protein
MAERIYLHEVIDIILSGRVNYFDHMMKGLVDWGHDRGMRIHGIWGTLGSTARWPEVINIWEYGDWANVANIFAHETRGHPGMQDPALKEWWLIAQKYRSGGFDRLMQARDCSIDADDLETKGIAGHDVFRHEIVGVQPGEANKYLDRIEGEWAPYLKTLGIELVGAYRTLLRDDSEAILVWSCPTWENWGDAEKAIDQGDQGKAWRASVRPMVTNFRTDLMVSAPRSPTKTGRQPSRDDAPAVL